MDLVSEHYGYKKEDITMLMDTAENMQKINIHLRPTRKNIVCHSPRILESLINILTPAP